MGQDFVPFPVAEHESSSVRQMLRSATADLHAVVDARFSGPFDCDRAAYVSFLLALARVVPPLEAQLEAAGVVRLLPDWPDRRRSAALRDDLDLLGTPMPGAAPVSQPRNEAQMLGMVYVLEGSRLGGKLLLRRVLDNPDPAVRAATRYLGHGVGRDLWRSFLERLEASAGAAAAPQDVVLGARTTFGLFALPPAHV
jgi:heme oxygenase